MGPLKHFRLMSVRLTLLLTVIVGGITYQFNPAAGQGVCLGGIGATVAFWMMAVRVEKLASISQDKLSYAIYRWTGMRMILYGAVLYKGYTLDPVSMHGLLGVAGGLMLLRVVLVFVAVTGIDLKSQGKLSDGADR